MGGGLWAAIFVIMKTFNVLKYRKLKTSKLFTGKEIRLIATMISWQLMFPYIDTSWIVVGNISGHRQPFWVRVLFIYLVINKHCLKFFQFEQISLTSKKRGNWFSTIWTLFWLHWQLRIESQLQSSVVMSPMRPQMLDFVLWIILKYPYRRQV